MNFLPNIKDRWDQDKDKYIAEATSRWTGYYGSMHAGPFNTMCYKDTWQRCANPSALA